MEKGQKRLKEIRPGVSSGKKVLLAFLVSGSARVFPLWPLASVLFSAKPFSLFSPTKLLWTCLSLSLLGIRISAFMVQAVEFAIQRFFSFKTFRNMPVFLLLCKCWDWVTHILEFFIDKKVNDDEIVIIDAWDKRMRVYVCLIGPFFIFVLCVCVYVGTWSFSFIYLLSINVHTPIKVIYEY